MFALGDVSADRFFREYWRKKPLFVKGGAHHLFDRRMTAVEFRQICDRMTRGAPKLVLRRPECIFAQNMNVGSLDLARRSKRFESMTACHQVWFDGVYAMDQEGIGSHFDHSDNFVLQQMGTKHWRLWSPSDYPTEALKARMLEDPKAGLVDPPPDALEYIVEAGDLLYIPLFWGHSGASVDGRSLSLSLVLNAGNALDLVLLRLREVLKDDERWWRPLPLLPRVADDASAAEVKERLKGLVASLAEPGLQAQAVEVLWRLVRQEQDRPTSD